MRELLSCASWWPLQRHHRLFSTKTKYADEVPTQQSRAPQKRGLEATGILAGMSKAAGFTSVSQLLVTNPNAKRPASASAKRPADAPAEAPAAKVATRPVHVSALFVPTQQLMFA